MRTLNEHRDEAFDCCGLALTKPRFDADAVERVRAQILAGLRRETTEPEQHRQPQLVARRRFPDHPYGRETRGTLETVPRITADDLRDYVRRVFARNELKIAIVGDIDAQAARRADRPRVRRAAGERRPQAALPRGDAAGARPAHRDRRSTCRRQWSRSAAPASSATIRISWPPISSTTSSAAARSPRGSIARCARSAASPTASSDSLVWFKQRRGGARRHRDARRPHRRCACDHRGGDQAHGRGGPDRGGAGQGQVVSQGLLRARRSTPRPRSRRS